jgi:hypothetical protein
MPRLVAARRPFYKCRKSLRQRRNRGGAALDSAFANHPF